MKQIWNDSRVRFVSTMALSGFVLWIVFREAIMGPILTPMRALTAEGTLWVIQLTGLDGFRQANYIFHSSGFGMEITRGCTGFAGAAVLATGIIAYPARQWRNKGLGLAIGLSIFIAINLIRMTHLYHLGVSGSPFFDMAHEVVWQIGMMVAVFLTWLMTVKFTT